MSATDHPNRRRSSNLKALFVVSIPLAGGILLWASMARLELPAGLALCGLLLAAAGGCTKVGSP
jgi:hypothetical protein